VAVIGDLVPLEDESRIADFDSVTVLERARHPSGPVHARPAGTHVDEVPFVVVGSPSKLRSLWWCARYSDVLRVGAAEGNHVGLKDKCGLDAARCRGSRFDAPARRDD
jgi:hypothetical protein